MNHMKVRHYWNAFICACWLAGAGGEARTLPILENVCRGLRLIILVVEGRSFSGASGRAKGAAKVLHFPRRCCISFFGAPDQREKGVNRGKKCHKKMHQRKCNTFGQNSAEMETPRDRACMESVPAAGEVGIGCFRDTGRARMSRVGTTGTAEPSHTLTTPYNPRCAVPNRLELR